MGGLEFIPKTADHRLNAGLVFSRHSQDSKGVSERQ